MEVNYSAFIDEWKLITGDDIKINDCLVIKHHTVKDVLEMGKDVYYNNIFSFIVSPHNYMVELWENGQLYSELSHWDFFVQIFSEEINPKSSTYKRYTTVFNGFENCNFQKCKKESSDDIVFYCKEKDCIIDEFIYLRVSAYLKFINNIPLKHDMNPSKDRHMAKLLIKYEVENERMNRRKKAHALQKTKTDGLLNYVNRLVWATGRSYEDILKMTLYQFRMGIETLNKIKNYEEIKLGYYTGNLDSKKILMKNYDWLNK